MWLVAHCLPMWLLQLLSQEVHRLQQALGAEVARLQAAQQELASIQAERCAFGTVSFGHPVFGAWSTVPACFQGLV